MDDTCLTPKRSAMNRRYPIFLKPSVLCGGIALVAVFAILVLMYFYMPPLP